MRFIGQSSSVTRKAFVVPFQVVQDVHFNLDVAGDTDVGSGPERLGFSMTTNLTTLNRDTLRSVVHLALLATDDLRWRAAIKKAAAWLRDGGIPRTLPNGHIIITSRTDSTKAYEIDGTCTCKAAENGNPCWHRAAARLWRRYVEAEAIRTAYHYQDGDETRDVLYGLTPAGEAIIHDAVTGECWMVAALVADPGPCGNLVVAGTKHTLVEPVSAMAA